MAGLLDMLGSDTGLLGLQLMAAGSAKPVRTGFGEGLLGALQGVQAQRAAEEDRKMKQQMQQAQLGLLGAQLDETKAQAMQRQAAVEAAQRQAAEQQRVQGLIRGAFMPVQPSQANAVSGIAGPRPEALSVVGQQPRVNYQALIAQGVPPELAQKLAEARNFGRDEVARTLEVAGPNGMPMTMQLDKFGGAVGPQLAKPVEMKLEDLGGTKQAFNPFALQAGQSFNKTNTPDAMLSAQTAMRGQNMTDARARDKNSIDRDAMGKVEWKQDVNGNWIALPKELSGNGPVTPVTTTAPGKREQQARNALDIISEAEKLIDKGTGSYIGAGVDLAARAFGAAPAGAVASGQLKALEGALMMAQPRMEGPQSDKDVALYRQMAAQIGDPTAPPKIKKAALDTVKELHRRYAGQGGQQAAPPAGGASLDDLLKKYGN